MVHYYSTSPKYSDLNSIAAAGVYDMAADGSATAKFREWK